MNTLVDNAKQIWDYRWKSLAEESVSERNLKMSYCGFEHGAEATGQGIRQPVEARQSEEMPSQGTPQRNATLLSPWLRPIFRFLTSRTGRQ